MTRTRQPKLKDELLEQIIQTFRQFGFEGSSLSVISAQTGLKRSSLYHHFPGGKEQMAEFALASVLEQFDRDVLAPLRDSAHPPSQKLKACADGLNHFYAEGKNACLIDIFSIGQIRKHFQEELALRTQAVIDEFTRVIQQAGIEQKESQHRAEDFVMSLQGALVLSRSLNTYSHFQRLLKEMPDRLLSK